MAMCNEEINLKVGIRTDNGIAHVDEVKFRGYMVVSATTFDWSITRGNEQGVDWEIYKIEDGPYLVWWQKWSRNGYEFDIADYEIVEEMPEAGDIYIGKTFDRTSEPFPEELSRVRIIDKSI